MIYHIVLFKIKNNVTENQVHDFYKNLYNLKEKIPGIIKISGGKNISPEGKSKKFSEGFTIIFEDKKSRDNYLLHEEHKKLIQNYIEPIIEDVLVFDY